MSKRILVFLLIVILTVGATVPAVMADTTPANPQNAYPWLTKCEEDLTGETLTLYHFGDLSGAYAFITQPIIAGLEDAITLMNDNGGICGATVAQEFRDTGGDTEQTQAFWDEFSAKDDAYLIYLYASADGELLLTQAEEAQIVLLNAAGSELALYGEDGEPSVQYSAIPLYVDQLGAFCDYIAANWADMGMEGDPVIGHLSWEGPFGRSSDTEGTRAYCEAAGVGYAGAEYFLPGTPDIAAQLQTLVDNGANIIYTTSLASGPAQVAGTVAALELDVVVSGANWALDTSVIGLGGIDTNGIIGNLPFLWWDEISEPGVQKVVNYWLENRMAVDPEAAVRIRNIAYITSFGVLDLWAEALIRTMNRVGYDNLSGTELNVTMGEMNYDAFDGLIPVDFTDGKRAGSSTRIGQIQFVESDSGVTPSVVPLTDWMPLPDLRVGGADIPE